MNANLKIEQVPIADLAPYEHNTRAHNDEDVAQIARSIERYGFNDPIGIWSDQNIIVEGHGRLMAARSLGMTEVPCVRLDHLTDEQRRDTASCTTRPPSFRSGTLRHWSGSWPTSTSPSSG